MFIDSKKRALALSMLSIIYLPAGAMQLSTARALSAVAAVGCAGGSYSLFNKMGGAVHPLVFASVSSVITFITYSFLYTFTPEGRLSRAIELLHRVYDCELIAQSFFDDRMFFDVLHEVYLTEDLPLINAYNQLIVLEPMCREAISLLHKVLGQVSQNSILEEKCSDVLSDTQRLLNNIARAVKRIKEHKDYLSQLHLYREYLMAEKQAFAQEQMANAQVQMANQKSPNIFKQLKAFFG